MSNCREHLPTTDVTNFHRTTYQRRDHAHIAVTVPAQVAVRRTLNPARRGEVQMGVAFVGLCGTDLHIFHGHMDPRVATPLIFGHEMSGPSRRSAPATRAVAGDRVTVMPLLWDDVCPACLAGATPHLSEPRLHRHRLPWCAPGDVERPSPRTLVALAGSAATRRRSARGTGRGRGPRRPPVRARLARGRRPRRRPHRRPHRVRRPGRRRRARRHRGGRAPARADPDRGFATPDPRATRPGAWVEEWTDGVGADVVFEVRAPLPPSPIDRLGEGAGQDRHRRDPPKPRQLDLQRVFWRELRSRCPGLPRGRFRVAVELLRVGRIPVEAIITRIVELCEDVPRRSRTSRAGRAMKVLVDPAGAGPE